MKRILFLSLLLNSILLLSFILFLNKQQDVCLKGELDFVFSNYENSPRKMVIQAISEADSSIDLAMYHFNDYEIGEMLVKAVKKGITVNVLTDEVKSSNKKSNKLLRYLSENGINVRYLKNEKMHLKLMIIDNRTVVFGSFNYLESSALDLVVTLHDKKISSKWRNIYSQYWNISFDLF